MNADSTPRGGTLPHLTREGGIAVYDFPSIVRIERDLWEIGADDDLYTHNLPDLISSRIRGRLLGIFLFTFVAGSHNRAPSLRKAWRFVGALGVSG
ncbi:hypothetical protein Zmor_012798 [Zophobas morio]|uniref:Uncharacterized protein n=1 Tax=Zophobas morio TaxID=2755281 RepID=A0AA38ME36_9CUCU|nr:hypothetical protein Zmor_012798 [Zophobas morio]